MYNYMFKMVVAIRSFIVLETISEMVFHLILFYLKQFKFNKLYLTHSYCFVTTN